MRTLNTMWRLAFILAALALTILAAALGTPSRQIYASTWTAQAGVPPAQAASR